MSVSSLPPLELLQASLMSTYVLYAGLMATAVATFTYMYRMDWVILLFAKYSPYLLSGMENKTVRVDDMHISFLDRKGSTAGKAEPTETVVFLHGFTACKEAMAALTVALPQSWRLIIPDLPAHGESLHVVGASYQQDAMVDRLHQFAEAVGLERFHLVGESMGAHLSLLYTIRHQHQVKTLTAMCPPMEDAKRSQFFTTLETTGRNVILADNVTEFDAMLALVTHQPSTRLPHRIRRALVDIQKMRMRGYEDVFFQMLLSRQCSLAYYQQLNTLELPVCLVWGEHDRVCDISGGHILKKVLPRAELKVVQRCGHALSVDRPRKASHIISNFIQSHLNQASSS